MSSLRVVSLLPSATEILHALGLGQVQVGRSHECDFPLTVKDEAICTHPTFSTDGSSAEIDRLVKEKLSSAASIYQIDSALMKELRPTHVLTQTLCDVCAVSLADVQSEFNGENGLEAEIVALGARSLDGVWDDIRRVAVSLGAAEAGERLVASLELRMTEIQQIASGASVRPRVAAIEWIEPVMAAGNWIPELIERAGADNLFGKPGEHSPWMEWEALQAADPDVIIGLPCGFDLERTRREMSTLAARPGWRELKAVRSGQVYVCDGNQFMNRPGPRLVESLQTFAEICHPKLFKPLLQRTGWERY